MSGQWVNFGSRQSSNPPRLVLTVGPDECQSNPSKGIPGQCGCDQADIDSNLDGVADCFDALVTATADTTTRLAVPFGNDGTGPLLGVTSASVVALERTLVRVDQTAIDAARTGRNVDKAYLEVTIAGIALGWGGGLIDVHPMNRDWPEGTGLAGHGPSWYCADDLNTTLLGNAFNDCAPADLWGMEPWQLLPIPFSSPPTDSEALFSPRTTSVRFDVTADVQRFVQGEPNFGWLIKGREDPLSGQWVNFGSRETGTPPRLLLDLSVPLQITESESVPQGTFDAFGKGVFAPDGSYLTTTVTNVVRVQPNGAATELLPDGGPRKFRVDPVSGRFGHYIEGNFALYEASGTFIR
jgi:hypothetical protein